VKAEPRAPAHDNLNVPAAAPASGASSLPHASGLAPVPPRWLFFLLLGLLFSAHVAVRLISSPIAELDESWQLVLSQHWALGYHSHPPLYTWLQIIVFKIFGESFFSLALLKNALLFGLYLFTYASARLLTRRHDRAVLAVLCLLLIPQIAWESQRDLTHSVLLSTATAAAVYSFLRLAEGPSNARYALLGLCVAVMILSKYNSGLFLIGTTAALMLVPRYRALLISPRIVITAAVILAVAGPHLAWVAAHPGEAFASTQKLDFRRSVSFAEGAVRLPYKVIRAALPNLSLVALFYFLVSRRRSFVLRNDPARLIFRASAISVGLLFVVMLVTSATALRSRWFQPMFVCAPILFVAQLEQAPRWLFRWVGCLATIVAISVLVLLPMKLSRGGGSYGQDLTAATLNEISSATGPTLRDADVIIADNFWIAGAMHLRLKKPSVVSLATPPDVPPPTHPVILFDANRSAQPSPRLTDWLALFYGHPVSVRVIHVSPDENRLETGMRIGVAVIEPGDWPPSRPIYGSSTTR